MGMRSIAVKLSLIFGAALAATILAITLYATLNVRRQAVDNFNDAGLGQIRQIDSSLRETFKRIHDNVVFLSDLPLVQSADTSVTNYLTHGGQMTPDTNGGVETDIFHLLQRFGDSHPDLRYVYVGTQWGGYVQWPKGKFTSDHYDPRERPWYVQGMQAAGAVRRTAAYANSGGDNNVIISFVRSIQNAQGKPVGVLGMDISLDGFAKMIGQVRFGETGYLMVVEDSGTVLVDPHDAAHNFKALKDLGDGYRDLAAMANGTLSVDIGGARYDTVVYTSPELGWKYIGLIPHAEMMASANRLSAMLIVVGLVVLLVALALTTALGSRLTAPLRQLSNSMQDIASGDGDLTRRLPVGSNDEVGVLAEQFNAFVEKLNGVLLDIRDSSALLRTATGEISTGNADLSARTEQQAAALEETAASMEELTAAVKQNAESARQASTLASDASDVARRSHEAVERVVSTMTDISQSSNRIADITGIIEGIAFQTNILALNAAVESARAGEHGRGFAVVASEVRSLAQRSSSAAKEIKELIGASVDRIRDGSSLAGEAGETMTEVTRAVGQVTAIMSEIAAASEEQSRGIAQVNLAITQMDDVTQQNAALVEQAAAASRSLEDQGRQLDESVAAFRLKSATAA
ncbi:methyl-accepting chemotaxis protein [Paraburkholderia hospita]|jgi:methyl-accepting chemotaxis protein|uniref:methyl-accepting chemotaxis protein n=1 Tax=Paraburkholderia hospita TaxID=169430 RepID=UPI0009A6EA15|nr:methyl-accepting chemotaxis protein [Paraburkholderia hospita]AXF04262.1 methyl-accepting chemotaxis protein [Paraburkholderia hospita]OUL86927.1 chemotaxis protein [Paraburkholderia hospita]SKC99801.1 methyl-accepting chemotaxis sensory transducer with Cache sensor [Paraburkholderia hospita]SOE91130.1 methyl-accepting chemotaxis sensory transducer with Cache sensor [Burkholderia sp. YR290]